MQAVKSLRQGIAGCGRIRNLNITNGQKEERVTRRTGDIN